MAEKKESARLSGHSIVAVPSSHAQNPSHIIRINDVAEVGLLLLDKMEQLDNWNGSVERIAVEASVDILIETEKGFTMKPFAKSQRIAA